MAVWQWVLLGILVEFALAVAVGRFIAAGRGPELTDPDPSLGSVPAVSVVPARLPGTMEP